MTFYKGESRVFEGPEPVVTLVTSKRTIPFIPPERQRFSLAQQIAPVSTLPRTTEDRARGLDRYPR